MQKRTVQAYIYFVFIVLVVLSLSIYGTSLIIADVIDKILGLNQGKNTNERANSQRTYRYCWKK